MVRDPETGTESAVNAHLRQAAGYRVDAPEGNLGLVEGCPMLGPLVLVVSDEETVRFVALQRVTDAFPFERRVVLGPRHIAPVSLGRVAPERKAA